MAFQRSYSKVWWGSDNQLPAMSNAGSSFTSGGYYYSYYSQQQPQHLQQQQHQQQTVRQHNLTQQQHSYSNNSGGYHSLDYNYKSTHSGNLSCIQEVDDEQNISKLSWEKHNSPGSLRSQDSGFSDNDESHSTRSLGRSSKTASPSTKSEVSSKSFSCSPSASTRSVATPPTVVRRVGKSEFYSPLVNVSRRISFSGSPASSVAHKKENEMNASIEGAEMMMQLDSMQLVNSTPKKLNFDDNDLSGLPMSVADDEEENTPTNKQKRRRRVIRKVTKPLTPTKRRTLVDNRDNSDDSDAAEYNNNSNVLAAYNNETVYLGGSAILPPPAPYNNETVILGNISADDLNNNSRCAIETNDETVSPLKLEHKFMTSTSTPKAKIVKNREKVQLEHPSLNGNSPAVQDWLRNLRFSYEHEVMSTLAQKSISQVAFKNLTITTNTVTKLIRQLQQRAMYIQSDFERVERKLSGSLDATLYDALSCAGQLVENVAEFNKVLERRSVFFTGSRVDRKKFEDNLEQIRIISKDTRYSIEKQHYISLESLLDDVQLLKRYLLITIRLVFEKMVRVIVQSIEQGRCDLMLRANINMIATLTNIDYEGFASLTDAFVQNEAVRTLLIVCLEHKLSSVRALALRALATLCCAPEAIIQLGAAGGIEVIRDILQVQATEHVAAIKKSDTEKREAVSLLAQITAAWHGPQHRVNGLKDCIESIVEGLTKIIANTSCSQTLLLCAAALNNLSRIEVTSHYSIMSNEAIYKMLDAVQRKENSVSVFLYEQILAMLHNMSLNKKCHSHLANGTIINFITSAHQTEFYKTYNSRAETDAQRRTIKTILHTLTRLVNDSCLGMELLEQHQGAVPSFMSAFYRMAAAASATDQWSHDSSHSRDISILARQLLVTHQQQQEKHKNPPEFAIEKESEILESSSLETKANDNCLLGKYGETLMNSSLMFKLTRQESFV